MSIGIGGIIGAILGFLFTRSIFGSLIGYFIGSSFDRVKVKSSGSYEQFRDRFNRPQFAEDYYTSRLTQNDFATALLILSGAVMKADGKVLKSELDYVKAFFKQQFSPNLAAKYISDFKHILQKNFALSDVCNKINQSMPLRQRTLLIQYLFGIAKADGHVSEQEETIIQRIANYFRISKIEYDQIKSMFYKDVSNAYKILGIGNDSSDEELKKAYRKMAVKHHPDKFNQSGEEQLKAAKEKFQKIQEAYEQIKKERGLK